MKTVQERIEDLFELTDKKQIAQEIDVILDDLASTIMVRLEREFCFYLPDGEFLASTCYTSPPAEGQCIKINGTIYQINNVIHSFSSNEAGQILVQKLT